MSTPQPSATTTAWTTSTPGGSPLEDLLATLATLDRSLTCAASILDSARTVQNHIDQLREAMALEIEAIRALQR